MNEFEREIKERNIARSVNILKGFSEVQDYLEKSRVNENDTLEKAKVGDTKVKNGINYVAKMTPSGKVDWRRAGRVAGGEGAPTGGATQQPNAQPKPNAQSKPSPSPDNAKQAKPKKVKGVPTQKDDKGKDIPPDGATHRLWNGPSTFPATEGGVEKPFKLRKGDYVELTSKPAKDGTLHTIKNITTGDQGSYVQKHGGVKPNWLSHLTTPDWQFFVKPKKPKGVIVNNPNNRNNPDHPDNPKNANSSDSKKTAEPVSNEDDEDKDLEEKLSKFSVGQKVSATALDEEFIGKISKIETDGDITITSDDGERYLFHVDDVKPFKEDSKKPDVKTDTKSEDKKDVKSFENKRTSAKKEKAPINDPVQDLKTLKTVESETRSGDFYIDKTIEKKHDGTFMLSVNVSGKRGTVSSAYIKALSVSKPELPKGFEYETGTPIDWGGKEVTRQTIKEDDDYYDDRGYTDSEFGGGVYYKIVKSKKK